MKNKVTEFMVLEDLMSAFIFSLFFNFQLSAYSTFIHFLCPITVDLIWINFVLNIFVMPTQDIHVECQNFGLS